MNTLTLIQKDSYPIVSDPTKILSLEDDFAIYNDPRCKPIYYNPTRLTISYLLLCADGYARLTVNMQEYYISPGSFTIALPDQIIQTLEISDQFKGICIGFTKNLSDEVFSKLKVILPFFFYTKEYPCLNLNVTEFNFLMDYCNMIWGRLKEGTNEFSRDIITTLLSSMFYEVYNIYRQRLPRSMDRKNRKEVLFDQFMRLLSEKYKEERSVNFYAQELFLTPKHLSSVVKEVSGKTAGEWIDNFVIFEAKAMLKASQKNIQEIADELNFANQSFFGKYFKHYTGMSPKDYRRM